MEDNSYKELMEFLGSQFGRIDEQLAEMRKETKQDLKEGLDDVKRHNEILIEDVKHGLQAIVDGQRMRC